MNHNPRSGDPFASPTEHQWKRTGTSAEAAKAASLKAPVLHTRCFDVIAQEPGGLTADEVARRLGHG